MKLGAEISHMSWLICAVAFQRQDREMGPWASAPR